MSDERKQKLLKAYAVALSCVIILAGVCLMVACVSIYRSGDEPFSRDAVAAAFLAESKFIDISRVVDVDHSRTICGNAFLLKALRGESG